MLPLLLALAGGGPPDLRELERRLAHPDPAARRHAVAVLGLTGAEAEPARPFLRRALCDPDPDVRLAAALALSRLDPPDPAALPRLRARRSLPRWPALLAVGAPLAGELLATRLSGRWPEDLPLMLRLAGSQFRTVPFELRTEAGEIADEGAGPRTHRRPVVFKHLRGCRGPAEGAGPRTKAKPEVYCH
jgi:HEAT repeats